MKFRKFTFTTLFISVALTACGSSTHSSSESSTTTNALVTTTGASVTTTEIFETTTTQASSDTPSFNEHPLDFLNATFNVRCPGLIGGGAYPYLATFSDGEAIRNLFGPDGTIRVIELKKAELVEESSGLETIIQVYCHGGGSGHSTELQVFAADPDKPTRLGSIFHHVHLVESDGNPFMLLEHDWADDDVLSATIRRIYEVNWDGEDWEWTLFREWRETPPE